jgi:membrane-associated protease RseP (regulator of RpoE activity)
MTDETAPGDATPEDATPEDATPGSPAVEGAPAAAPVEAAPRKGVFVPRWLAILLGIAVAVGLVGGGGFALGRSTADDDHHERVEDRRDGPSDLPPLGDRDGRGDGNGGNGSGSGDSRPTPPAPTPTSRVYLGVAVARESGTDGARVTQVVSGSPADEAGLEVGDVITAVDGTTVADATELATAIQDHDAGDTVTITYDRDGAVATATVELAERPQSDAQPGLPSTSPPA